jgi:hypothetical protein
MVGGTLRVRQAVRASVMAATPVASASDVAALVDCSEVRISAAKIAGGT